MSTFRFTRGPQTLVDAFNKCLDEVDENRVASSGTVRVASRGLAGTLLESIGGGVATTIYTPFEIFANKHIVSGVWDNTYDVTLYPGVVNQLLPSNIFSPINQGISSTLYVILTGASDGYSVTSSAWSLESSAPAPVDATADTPPSSFTVVIGVIFWNAVTSTFTIYQIIQNNLSAQPIQWLTVSRATPEPFLSPVQYYWTWQVLALAS